ncbi:hypothetical protein PG988_010795 [Apiospora saccharicola]
MTRAPGLVAATSAITGSTLALFRLMRRMWEGSTREEATAAVARRPLALVLVMRNVRPLTRSLQTVVLVANSHCQWLKASEAVVARSATPDDTADYDDDVGDDTKTGNSSGVASEKERLRGMVRSSV